MISITAGDLYIKSNYQDFERYPELDIAMAADAEATLPALIEAVKKLITPDRKNAPEIAEIYQKHLLGGIKWALRLTEGDAGNGNVK